MTRRLTDYFAGALSGMLVALVICAAIAPDAWTVAPTPRPSPQADLGSAAPRMTPDGVSPVPSPDVAARTGSPDTEPAPMSASPSPTGTRPAATARPKAATPLRHRLTGNAVWYVYRRGHAAAGPALRAALGPRWRGKTVTVCSGPRCVRVVLSDWCACRTGNRVVDLDRAAFAALAPTSRGVIPVTVRW